MIPAFVIGLREGVEAALIIGMIAAFLVRAGRRDALRPLWAGVVLAVGACAAVGLGLHVLDEALPEEAQELLEGAIALVACAMVTWMILWMRRHAATLRASLEGSAAAALAAGGTTALVLMAVAAVLREGFETALFLVATLHATTNAPAAAVGAVGGIAAAAWIGILVYRGGLRIDLVRFFRITGLVLVLVAAGLLASAVHSLHEIFAVGGLDHTLVDLGAIAPDGSVQAALATGMLGIRPEPTVAEVLAWLLYAVPMALLVLRPGRRDAGAPAPAVA